MSHFAYHVAGGKAERISAEQALAIDSGLVWIHLATNDADAQAWLADKAGLGDYLVDALTATDPVVGTTRKYVAGLEHVEAADPADLHQALDRVRPDVVINAAGLLAGTATPAMVTDPPLRRS